MRHMDNEQVHKLFFEKSHHYISETFVHFSNKILTSPNQVQASFLNHNNFGINIFQTKPFRIFHLMNRDRICN